MRYKKYPPHRLAGLYCCVILFERFLAIRKGEIMKKKIFALILSAVMVLGLVGCKDSSSDAQGTASGAENTNTIVYGSNDYTRINPAMDEHGEINVLIFDGLTDHDGDNQVIPRLAKSWEYDEATCTYTFHLEEGVKWHDGEEFTAEDVKLSLIHI